MRSQGTDPATGASPPRFGLPLPRVALPSHHRSTPIISLRNTDQPAAKPPSGGGGAVYQDLADDPVEFVRQVLCESPYQKQEQMLRALAGSRRVSVVGCNASGKDWTAARCVLWWMHSREPAKAIVTGPTTRQVDDIVWNEMRFAHGRAADRLGGKMFRSSRYEVDGQSFALGFASNSPFNLQGFHSPNLLVVITEAHAVRAPDVNALRRLNPSRLLMTGNPFVMSGPFYDSHHAHKHLYATVQISAFDTPNLAEGVRPVEGLVTAEDIEDRKAEWGEDDPLYVGGVLGRFPDNLSDYVVPLWAARAAGKRNTQTEGPLVIACDVARYGNDHTVVMRRQGQHARIVYRKKGNDTMATANLLKDYCDEHGVQTLVVDETGLGAGVVDRLREIGLGNTRLVRFIGGSSARTKTRFANRIAEVWWMMRECYLAETLDTDDDQALIEQVSSRKWDEDERGRKRLQSKRELARSPDEADALAMTFAAERDGVRLFT